MKKALTAFLSTLLITAIAFAVSDSVNEKTKTFDYRNFYEIAVTSGMHINIMQSDNYSVKVTGEENDLEDLVVEKIGKKLRFRYEEGLFDSHGDMYINVTMPELTEINLNGGSICEVNIDIGHTDFSALLSDNSELSGNIKCGDIKLVATESCKLELSGEGDDLKLTGSGDSIYQLKNFSAKDVNALLSETNAIVTMNGHLTYVGSGSSHFTYYGHAILDKLMMSDGSKIHQVK